MSKEVTLTTVDNPFDPFEQFALWDLFDHEKGYNTKERLARIVRLSDDMTQKEEDDEIERDWNRTFKEKNQRHINVK